MIAFGASSVAHHAQPRSPEARAGPVPQARWAGQPCFLPTAAQLGRVRGRSGTCPYALTVPVSCTNLRWFHGATGAETCVSQIELPWGADFLARGSSPAEPRTMLRAEDPNQIVSSAYFYLLWKRGCRLSAAGSEHRPRATAAGLKSCPAAEAASASKENMQNRVTLA